MKKAVKLAGALILGLVAGNLYAQESLPYRTGFESSGGFLPGNLAGQGGWSVDQGRALISPTSGRDRTQGLVIEPSEPFGQVSLHLTRPEGNVVFSDFWVKPVAAEGDARQFVDLEGAITGFFKIDQTGELHVLDGEGDGSGEWVSTGMKFATAEDSDAAQDWIRVTIRQDFENKVWDIFVNELLVGADLGFWSNDTEFLERFSLMGHSSFPLQFDDLHIAVDNTLFDDRDRNGIPDVYGNRDDDDDQDGLSNLEESVLGTRHDEADTDGDGIGDGLEVANGNSPTDASDSVIKELHPRFSRGIDDDVIGNSWIIRDYIEVDGSASSLERLALARALSDYAGQSDRSKVDALEAYLRANPRSPYRLSLEVAVAKELYNGGRYSRALSAYESLWRRYRNSRKKAPALQRQFDRASVDLASLYAKLGRKNQLRPLLGELIKREIRGGAAELLYQTRLALGTMEREPQSSFNCGPAALQNIKRIDAGMLSEDPILSAAHATENGFSLSQLQKLADMTGIALRMAKREGNAEIVVPALVHWRAGHYAAIVHKEGDKYRIEDPTFARTALMTQDAMNDEASGYFMIPADSLPAGWTWVSESEGATIWGKGEPAGQEYWEPCPVMCPGDPGVAQYGHNLFKGLHVVADTPIFSESPAPYNINFTVRYTPSLIPEGTWWLKPHFGTEQWVCNWGAHVEISSSYDIVWLPDGRREIHSSGGHKTSAILDLNPDGDGYVRRADDGSIMVFAEEIGDLYYLTEMKNSVGNVLTITNQEHDSVNAARPWKVTDDYGNGIEIIYATSSTSGTHNAQWYRITEVRDIRDSNRKATFSYSSSPTGNNETDLTKITDVVGIESSFIYTSAEPRLHKMTTPYGTTTFTASIVEGSTSGIEHATGRSVNILDPMGHTERIEFRTEYPSTHALAGCTYSGSNASANSAEIPASGVTGSTTIKTDELNEGVSLYWDKKIYNDHTPNSSSGANYDKAYQTRWAHNGTFIGVPLSRRSPLSYREFYQYEGESSYTNTPSDHPKPALIASRLRDQNGTLATSSVHFEYNDKGNVTKHIDATNRETKFTYENGYDDDELDGIDIKTVEILDGSTWKTVVTYTYETDDTEPEYGKHVPLTVKDAGGNITSYTYNAKMQVQQITYPASTTNGIVKFYYDDDPRDAYVAEPGDFEFEGYLVKVERTNPSGSGYVTIMENTSFDTYYRVATSVDADGYDRDFLYDKLNRVTQITHPETPTATTELFSYVTNVGSKKVIELQKYTDREGKTTKYEHNGNRQLWKVTDSASQVTEYHWCRCGDLEWIKDPAAKKTEWIRDIEGRVTEKRYPAVGGTTHKTYYTYQTESGLLSTVRYPKDSSATFTLKYYKDGNLQKVDYADSSMTDLTYTYDSDYNRLKSRTDEVGTWNYYYHSINGSTNGAGKLRYVNGPWSWDSRYHYYDDLGRVNHRKIDYSSTTVEHDVVWEYDTLGRVKAIDTPHSSTDFTIAYEGNGPLVNYIDYPNGQRVDYAWKSKTSGRFLDSITNNKTSSGTQISKFDYPTHSGSGQIKSWTKTQKDNLGATVTTPWTITYDNLYRVDQVNNTSGDDYDFDYDSSDNRTRRKINGSGIQYQVNARNQLTQPSSGVEYKFSYDANGNITERRNSSTNALLIEYEWDAINRLKAVEIPGTSRSEFFYDGQHRCYKKIEKNGSGTVLSTEYYVWCGTERCQKRVGSSNPADIKSNYYSYGETRHTSTSNSTPYYYTFDHLGSLREVTNSSGVVQVAYDYTPYGERSEVVGASGSWSLDAEWGFTGHYYHEQTGLHLALYRAYDAEMGRWLSPDPIEEAGGLNLYGYVGGDPINYWDPFGLKETAWEQTKRGFKNFGKAAVKTAQEFPAAAVDAGEKLCEGAKETFSDPAIATTAAVSHAPIAVAVAPVSIQAGGYQGARMLVGRGTQVSVNFYTNNARIAQLGKLKIPGVGLNLLKNGTRRCGIELHRFMTKGPGKRWATKLHRHVGKTASQISKHRKLFSPGTW